MRDWLRQVWPPWQVLVALGLVYGGMVAVVLLGEGRLEWPLPRRQLAGCLLFPSFLAGVYGIYRVGCFHPLSRSDYFKWLATTPWTSRQPLPLGPIHLVGQDLLLIGLATLVIWVVHGPAAWVLPGAFLFFYLATLAWALVQAGERPYAYGVGFGLGLMLLLLANPVLCFTAALGTYALACLGLRESLKEFPWEQLPGVQKRLTQRSGEGRSSGQEQGPGWPFAQLGPRLLPTIPWVDKILASLLIGWWHFVIILLPTIILPTIFGPEITREQEVQEALWKTTEFGCFLYVCTIIGTMGGRLGVYCLGYAPPISFLGRLATGRLIIPGYDQVFVAPLLTGAAAGALPWILSWLGLGPVIYLPITVSAMLLITLGVGPSLRTWRLTGEHRIVSWDTGGTVKAG